MILINTIQGLPTIENYEKIGLISLLIFIIMIMGGVIFKMWTRINTLADKISELQESFNRQLLDAHQKTLLMFPSIEKSVLDSNINITDKIMSKIDANHNATRTEIKETIKENNKCQKIA